MTKKLQMKWKCLNYRLFFGHGLTQEKKESAAQEWQQLGFFQKNTTF